MNSSNLITQKPNNGIVLTMVLYVLVVFVIISLVLVTLMVVNNQASYQLLYSTQAYYLAEAGLEYGLYQLSPDPMWLLESDGLSFDGIDDYVSVLNSSSLQVTGNLTVEFWIKPTNIAKGRQNIVDKAYGGEFAFTQETNGSISFYYGTCGGRCTPYQGFGSGAGSAVQNEWHHFALVRDLTTMRLYWYKDGNLLASTAAAYSSATASSYNVTIGSGYTGVYYEGIIDEVRIYNRALTPQEIAFSYNYRMPMNRTGLVGWWKFASGYTSIDSSGSGNNGRVYGATSTIGVYKSSPVSLATQVSFNPPGQSNCFFSVDFTPSAIQLGRIISSSSVYPSQVISLDKAPAQRVLNVAVPRIY